MKVRHVRTDTRSWFDLFLAHNGWIAILAAAALCFFTIASVWQYGADAAFAKRGVPVSAEVVAAKPVPNDGQNRVKMTLSYAVPEGHFAQSIVVSAQYAENLPLGSEVAIYYLPRDPARISRGQFASKADGSIWQVLAAVAGVAALGFGARAGGLATSAVRARRFGVRRFAKVTRLQVPLGQEHDGLGMVRMVFQDEDGRFGKTMLHPLDYLQLWDEGDVITVYRGPRCSWWEGDVGARALGGSIIPQVDKRTSEL